MIEVQKRTWKKHLKRMMRIYKGIVYRCTNVNATGYLRYGGRGIVCEWKTFENFFSDMRDSYKGGLTIDRINNDGNYCKENCRWITVSENSKKGSRSLIDPTMNYFVSHIDNLGGIEVNIFCKKRNL